MGAIIFKMSVEELFQDNELVKKANDYIRRHKVNELFEVGSLEE